MPDQNLNPYGSVACRPIFFLLLLFHSFVWLYALLLIAYSLHKCPWTVAKSCWTMATYWTMDNRKFRVERLTNERLSKRRRNLMHGVSVAVPVSILGEVVCRCMHKICVVVRMRNYACSSTTTTWTKPWRNAAKRPLITIRSAWDEMKTKRTMLNLMVNVLRKLEDWREAEEKKRSRWTKTSESFVVLFVISGHFRASSPQSYTKHKQ